MLGKFVTMDGSVVLLNMDHITVVGPISADGQPVVGMQKIMLSNGAALVVKGSLEDILSAVNGEVLGG